MTGFIYEFTLNRLFSFSQVPLVILSPITVALHSPPKIAIMTIAQATVPRHGKAAGGTKIAMNQTWMVCTWMGSKMPKECAGTTGKTSMSLLRGLKWRFVQRTSKIRWTSCYAVVKYLSKIKDASGLVYIGANIYLLKTRKKNLESAKLMVHRIKGCAL